MTEKMLSIYLIDPIHNYIKSRDNWMVPLCVMSIGAYVNKLFGDSVRIRCFKFPNLLLEAIDQNPPDILAASNYVWNESLSNLLMGYAKIVNPGTVTVMGGPNITASQQAMTSFLRRASCDFYVEGAGEHPFAMIVKAMLDGRALGDLFGDERVHSVWRFDPATGLAQSKPKTHVLRSLDEIPSPYISGMADEFFNQGLLPMLETNRGCPYSCTYCVWGIDKKVQKFDLDRVLDDLDYCCRNASGGLLMINDANFGLYKRDLDIAKQIKRLHDDHGWPESVVVNWGQVRSDDVLKVAEALKGICILRQSSQSLNSEVLKNINRNNIGVEEWRKVLAFTKGQGLETFGEFILMLPGETLESYIAGLRFLFEQDVDCINTNQLQLLEGACMNTPEEREKYGMRTKWRLFENTYGVYRGRSAVECVELVVETDTFSEEQCLLCRPLNWLIQASWTMRWHDLLPRLLASLGVNPTDFFLEAVKGWRRASEPVRTMFEGFLRDTRAELFETKEALVAYYSQPEVMKGLRQGQFKKLNTHYCAEIMGCPDEFLEYYRTIALSMVDKLERRPADFETMVEECCRYLRHRFLDVADIEAMEAGEMPSKILEFKYNWLAWSRDTKTGSLEDHCRSDRVRFVFAVNDNQRRIVAGHMQKFAGISREYQFRKLLEPFYGVPREYLMFSIRALA